MIVVASGRQCDNTGAEMKAAFSVSKAVWHSELKFQMTFFRVRLEFQSPVQSGSIHSEGVDQNLNRFRRSHKTQADWTGPAPTSFEKLQAVDGLV
jgi:hypothetical protein